MKVYEAMGMDGTTGMSYEEGKAALAEFRDEVEGLLGYDLNPANDGTNEKRPTPHPLLNKIRIAFLKGLRPDEAAEMAETGEEPDRFQNELSDEDIANMGGFEQDNDWDNEDNYEIDPDDDFTDPRDEEDYTDYSMRQGEMGNPDRQR